MVSSKSKLKKKEKAKLFTILGLGTLLVHNSVEIDLESLHKIKDKLSSVFDGDNQQALDYMKEHFSKLVDEVKDNENK